MSEYEYIANESARFRLAAMPLSEKVCLKVQSIGEPKHVDIPNADVPTVAAELLKAAGREGVFVARGVEPSLEEGGNYLHFRGPDGRKSAISTRESPEALRRQAAIRLVAAEYIENKATQEADAEKKLQERRDALAAEFSAGGWGYEDSTMPTKRAIERIIEMEAGK